MENEASRFTIDDDLKANWAIKKIGEHMRKIEGYEASRDMFVAEYQKRIETTKDICTEYCAEHQRAIDFLKESLMEYAEANMPKGKRTWKFPEGDISFRKMPPKFFFKDGEELSSKSERLIDLLAANAPNYVKLKTTTTADWTRFKTKLYLDEETGDVILRDTGEVIKEFKGLASADKFIVTPTNVGGNAENESNDE